MRIFIGCCLFIYSVLKCGAQVFPGAPGDASFVYDTNRGELLLIGAETATADRVRNDIWKWSGVRWHKIAASGPGTRDYFPAAYNTRTGLTYCFGGIEKTGDGRKGDLWAFDGEQWHITATANEIGARDHHALVYMDHLNSFLLYGGNGADDKDDTVTWLLKDGRFTALHIEGPGIRYHTAMVYDKDRKKVVLYGGGQHPDEQWEFDGNRWEKINSPQNPGRKLYHSMVYDEDLKMLILQGGWKNQNPRDSTNFATPATWAYDGSTWRKIAEEPIFQAVLGYDAKRKVVVAYGRTGKAPNASLAVWELQNLHWVKVEDYRQ